MNQFTKKVMKVQDLDEKVVMLVLHQGTLNDYFKMSLIKHSPENMLKERVGKYIKTEENMKKVVNPVGGTQNSKKRK